MNSKGSTVTFHSRQVPISSKNNRAARNAHAKARQEFKTYDTSAIKPKRSKTPIIVLCVVLVAIIVAVFLIIRGCTADADLLPANEEAIVVVAPGEGAKDIAQTLKDEHLVGNVNGFVDLVTQRKAAESLIPGTYLFHGGMSQDEILNALLAGPASTADTLTVPEGFTRQAIADAVQSATHGRIAAQSFMDATADASQYVDTYDFLESAGENSLEGFLFPKTYSITATDDAVSLTHMMLSQFRTETEGLDWSYPEENDLTLYDVIKLASIVEKEADAETAATVASVFYNRLGSDRPYLESDATTAYEVGHDPTGDEVHADTPYSTYTHEGLPPTPICNPSLAAIEAVCSPESTDYMFFYTYEDGSYAFSETYDEHLAAIG